VTQFKDTSGISIGYGKDPNQNVRQFIFRADDVPAGSSDLQMNRGAGASQQTHGNPQTTYYMTTAALPKSDATVNLKAGIATGEWKDICEVDWSPGNQVATSATTLDNVDWNVSFNAPVEMADKSTLIAIGFSGLRGMTKTPITNADYETRLIVLDKDGHEHTDGLPEGATINGTARWSVTFKDLPLDRIKTLRFEARPYTWVEFDNVVLDKLLQNAAAPASQSGATPSPSPLAESREVLTAELQQAKTEAEMLEKQYETGTINDADLEKAKARMEILQAELAGDPMQVARITLAAAQRQEVIASKLYKAGVITSTEYEKTKGDVAIAGAKLREAEGAGAKAAPPASPSVAENREVLTLELQQAQAEADRMETAFKANAVSISDFDAAKDKVEILQAELAGDAVQVARINLAAAQRQLERATPLYRTGAMTAEEYEKAKSDVAIAEAKLREAESARGASATPSPAGP
jgi:multidrug resistance efflux pump